MPIRRVCYPIGIAVLPATGDVPTDIAQRGWESLPDNASVLPVPIIPPFYAERPPNARDFATHFTGTLAAGAGLQVVLVPLASLTIPNGTEAVITGVTIGVLNALGTLNISVALRGNQAAIAGLNAIVPWPVAGAVSAVELSPRTFVRGSTQLDLIATNLSAAGPWIIHADVVGYQYAATDRIRVHGETV